MLQSLSFSNVNMVKQVAFSNVNMVKQVATTNFVENVPMDSQEMEWYDEIINNL